jgi:hypothetical protein
MGRRKGSLNKKHKLVYKTEPLIKRKRGRPRKIVEPLASTELPIYNIRRSKFLGYCPQCKSLINSLDLISKFIFVCPACSERNRIKKLKKDLGNEKISSKKEYLEITVNSQYLEAPPMRDEEVKPKDLKIRDI